MDSDKVEKLKKRLMILEIFLLVVLFFILAPPFTGNVTNETCKTAWQSCPNGNSDCCSGLTCQGGTCKIDTSENSTSTNSSSYAQNQSSCKTAWQSCPNGNSDCCYGLTCQGGTCKTAVSETKDKNSSTIIIPLGCNNSGNICEQTSDCCSGLKCINQTCKGIDIPCIDSDGGKNTYLKGHSSGLNLAGDYFLLLTDNCTISGEEVEEFYCENESIKSESIFCSNGCEKGACKCKYTGQTCFSSLECCLGFSCINETCISKTEEIPSSLKNKVLCTFIGYPCEIDDDCCSRNCQPDWEFVIWESDIKKCGFAKLS